MINRTCIRIVVLIAFVAAGVFRAEKTAAQEVNYKAYSLFVYNFMKYMEWPEEATKDGFTIGVWGDSPIMKELQAMAANKKIKNKPIVIKKLTSVDDVLACQMVYISSAKSNTLKTIKEKVKGKPVLLVGEREGLAAKGAALSFVTQEDDALKFDINKAAIKEQNLKIATALLALGFIVG